MAQHNTLGAAGEQFAYEFLIREGFIVRERNWTMNHLEVDIIAERNGTFHFVEVKTRAANIINAASVISESKVRNIINAGKAYFRFYNIAQISMQIDIIYVIGQPGNFKILHIENAVKPHHRNVKPRWR